MLCCLQHVFCIRRASDALLQTQRDLCSAGWRTHLGGGGAVTAAAAQQTTATKYEKGMSSNEKNMTA